MWSYGKKLILHFPFTTEREKYGPTFLMSRQIFEDFFLNTIFFNNKNK